MPGRAGAGVACISRRLLSGLRTVEPILWLNDLRIPDGEGGLDEGGVGEGLWVVAEVGATYGIHLFGEEAEWAGELEEVRELLRRFGESASGGEGLD